MRVSFCTLAATAAALIVTGSTVPSLAKEETGKRLYLFQSKSDDDGTSKSAKTQTKKKTKTAKKALKPAETAEQPTLVSLLRKNQQDQAAAGKAKTVKKAKTKTKPKAKTLASRSLKKRDTVALAPTTLFDTPKRKKKPSKPGLVDPKFEPRVVSFSGYAKGTIVIDSKNKFLYLVEGGGKARRYGVAVGRQGLSWTGTATIKRKTEWPSWRPTKNMIKRSPGKYKKYANGMKGGPNNPLGARAMYLYQGNRDTHIRIHGTTAPSSIGRAASNGCFRMVNDHVIDLYNRVPKGTRVIVH